MAEPYYDETNKVCTLIDPATEIQRAAEETKGTVSILAIDKPIEDKKSLRNLIGQISSNTWRDFAATNEHVAGKGAKFLGSLLVGGAVAAELGAKTPLGWTFSRFGALPAEFTKSGAIQVFEYTTAHRALLVARAVAAKFILVTISFEGGVLVGSLINQALPESTQDAIGGTINEIVNEGGWKLLFTHPFGIGM